MSDKQATFKPERKGKNTKNTDGANKDGTKNKKQSNGNSGNDNGSSAGDGYLTVQGDGTTIAETQVNSLYEQMAGGGTCSYTSDAGRGCKKPAVVGKL